MGGCQFALQRGDNVLWAFDAFNKVFFLKVEPNKIAVRKGDTRTVKITDGSTGVVVPGAVIGGVTTDAKGEAVLTFAEKGIFTLKAERADSIRSNALYVVVG